MDKVLAHKILEEAKEVLRLEAIGITGVIDQLDNSFPLAVSIILNLKGRVVVTGIGKSGLVGRKIAATLSSTGTPSIYLHSVEALHGDLGMVQPGDLLLALSNSGETKELNQVVEMVKKNDGCQVIAMTGNPLSPLAELADLVLTAKVEKEACPLGLAPTASSTATLALGDALAVVLSNRRQFAQSDFKRYHPGGSLGERLAKAVAEVMLPLNKAPIIHPQTSLPRALQAMNEGGLGVLLVVDETEHFAGLFTDGDLRRLVTKGQGWPALNDEITIGEVMIANPTTIGPDLLAAKALELMQEKEITTLPIIGLDNSLLGVIHLHDLLGRGQLKFST